MKTRHIVLAVVGLVVLGGIIYLVASRRAPAPLLDDTDADTGATEPSEASRIVAGIGTGLTAVGASIAEAVT